jgi:hypothetical protein
MALTNDGYLGIGTITPLQTLQVNGKALIGSATDGLFLAYGTGYASVIGYDPSDGYNSLDIRATTGIGSGIYLSSTGKI